MQQDKFVWDEDKYNANLKKHGIAFNEATSVFDDVNALYFADEKHSDEEERFIVIGMSDQIRMLMVCHCYRDKNSVIRLISARKANKNEIAQYRG